VKTRSVVLALLLAACASAPAPVVGPTALRGCWIERREASTVTQRWFPKSGGVWQGDEITYLPAGDPDAVRWKLVRGDDGAPFSMCMVELSMMSSPPCWRAFFGPGAADGDDTQWVEIDVRPETLKITYVTGGDRAVTFDGRRDGCD